MRFLCSIFFALLALAAGASSAEAATLHSCPTSGTASAAVSRGFYVTSYQGYSLENVTLNYKASVAGTYAVTLTARLSTYDGTQIGSTQIKTFTAPTSGETPVTFSFGGAFVAHGSIVTFTQQKTSGPGNLFFDTGMGPCQYLQQTAGTSPPLDTVQGSVVAVSITGSSTPILPPPVSCAWAFNPTSQTISAEGGPTSVQLTTTPEGCSWTVTNPNPGCIYSLGPTSGSGTTTIGYSVAANMGTFPIGCILQANGATFNLTVQGCTFALPSSSASVASSAGSATFAVTPSGWACLWGASTSASWITITSGADAQGPGSVGYSFAANTGAARSGTINVMGQTFTVNQAAGTPLPNYSDSYWNSSESGWGLTVSDHGSNAFVQWYTYDATGHNQKYVISGGTFTSNKCQFSGTLTHVTGPSWTSPAFDPSLVVRTTAGTGTIDFCPIGLPAGTIVFNYTADGVTGSKQLTRLSFGNDVPHYGGTANTGGPDFTDLWWNPGESGWGVSVTQHGNNVFFRIFVYDTDGRPLLFVVPGVTFSTASSFTGTLQLTTGPYFGTTPFDPAQVVRTTAGSATMSFSDANNGVLTYTVNGVTKSKAVTRLIF